MEPDALRTVTPSSAATRARSRTHPPDPAELARQVAHGPGAAEGHSQQHSTRSPRRRTCDLIGVVGDEGAQPEIERVADVLRALDGMRMNAPIGRDAQTPHQVHFAGGREIEEPPSASTVRPPRHAAWASARSADRLSATPRAVSGTAPAPARNRGCSSGEPNSAHQPPDLRRLKRSTKRARCDRHRRLTAKSRLARFSGEPIHRVRPAARWRPYRHIICRRHPPPQHRHRPPSSSR